MLQRVKATKKLFKSSPAAIDASYLIMLHIDGNIVKKFSRSLLSFTEAEKISLEK